MADDLELLPAERAIQRVRTQYSRGVDRFDFESVRACHWPDGPDAHGSFVGGVDDFITFARKSLLRFERRDGQWRIHRRVCAYEWRRTDPVDGEGGFEDAYVRGLHSTDDIVYHILDR